MVGLVGCGTDGGDDAGYGAGEEPDQAVLDILEESLTDDPEVQPDGTVFNTTTTEALSYTEECYAAVGAVDQEGSWEEVMERYGETVAQCSSASDWRDAFSATAEVMDPGGASEILMTLCQQYVDRSVAADGPCSEPMG